jgi:hypothetical protein
MRNYFLASLLLLSWGCSDKDPVDSTPFRWEETTVDNRVLVQPLFDVRTQPDVRIRFSEPVDRSTVASSVFLVDRQANTVPVTLTVEPGDTIISLRPQSALAFFSQHVVKVNNTLLSASRKLLDNPDAASFYTRLDSSDKFPRIPDSQLMDSVQRRTFTFFWEDAHPVSGMARERNSSGDLVTSGGTGFGIMAMVSAVERGFITRAQARDRLLTMTDFLLNRARRYHGAFAHWMNGATGATIPFSPNDDGADLVETSYLIMGLLTAREYFNSADINETTLRQRVDSIWYNVEWDWFRRNNENVLYWHWSEGKGWIMNLRVQGWNECLVTYVLAASSPTHPIPAEVYNEGFARNGGMRNGRSFYGYPLPAGPDFGGPLFFAHYSFLGIDPRGLRDAWVDYEQQVVNHSKINHAYCKANPRRWYGYSDSCWGLTASDNSRGYSAHEPNNDLGVITPTAALSSIPFTPAESMRALHFFYYVLGDRIWTSRGFVDAFELATPWFANSYLAIDQGPIIVMMENHRSQLFWNLMHNCPELRDGLRKLGFTAPYL